MRIPPELAERARANVGSDVDLSTLVRAGLAMLAGAASVAEALAVGRTHRGPKPRPGASG
jgi:hypothetical protein